MVRRVVGASMQPTLMPGRIVIATSLVSPRSGRIVIATLMGREVIKRVSSVAGNEYFLQGDNMSASTDSRQYGAVHLENIEATLIWPRTR